jgi:hypothetical protein
MQKAVVLFFAMLLLKASKPFQYVADRLHSKHVGLLDKAHQ